MNLFYIIKKGGLLLFLIGFTAKSFAQICNVDGNVIVYSNYDGGIINIDIDQNIANLKVGICTYGAVEVNFTGAFVGNITQVIYAGYNSSGSCIPGVDSTIISGVDASIVTLYSGSSGNSAFTTYLGNPLYLDGPPLVNCMTGASGLGCSDVTDNEGGNSSAQIVDFFLTEFGAGSLLYLHFTQYNCFEEEIYTVSSGGNCCLEIPNADINLIYDGGSNYNFLPETADLCDGAILLDLSFYPVLYQPPYYTGYVWSDGTEGPIFSITDPGIYFFTVTDYCHSDPDFLTDTIIVTACCTQPEPPTIVQPNPICYGEEVPLLTATALGNGSIAWYADEALTNLIQSTDTLTAENVIGTTIYYVTETIDSCESTPAQVIVTIIASPQIEIFSFGSTSFCNGDSVTLQSGEADSYLWEGGQTNPLISVNTAGYITLEVTQGNCSATDSILITVNDFPVFDLGDDFSTCELSATLEAPLGFTYLWSDYSTSNTLEVIDAGNYSVEVSNVNCTSTDNIQVEFGNLSNIDLGEDISTCITPITLSTIDNNSYIYLWNTSETTASIEVAEAGIYSVTVQSGECIAEDSIMVTLGVLPQATLGEDVVVCFQPSYQLTVVTNEESIAWFDGSSLTTTTIDQPGNYWVAVTDTNSCQTIDSIFVDFASKVNLGINQSICAGELVYLDGGKGDQYLWNGELGTRYYEVNAPGKYFAQVIYGSCISSDSITITGSLVETNVYFPNTFTPNSDGLNDLFAGISESENIVSYQLRIYSRWGELVFESYDLLAKWNGTYSTGYFANDGLYIFKAQFATDCSYPEIKKVEGMINLIR